MKDKKPRSARSHAEQIVKMLHGRPLAEINGEYDLGNDIEQMEEIIEKHLLRFFPDQFNKTTIQP